MSNIARSFFKLQEEIRLHGYDSVARLSFFPLMATYVNLSATLPNALASSFSVCAALNTADATQITSGSEEG